MLFQDSLLLSSFFKPILGLRLNCDLFSQLYYTCERCISAFRIYHRTEIKSGYISSYVKSLRISQQLSFDLSFVLWGWVTRLGVEASRSALSSPGLQETPVVLAPLDLVDWIAACGLVFVIILNL